MAFIKLTDLDLAGKRVLIRADLNVPVKDGKVTSDARITASMPTIEHCANVGAKVMVRGLRMSADFEREFEMAMMNRKLDPKLELVCLMATQEYQFLSSSLLKEVANLEGDISSLVPNHVAKALKEKI